MKNKFKKHSLLSLLIGTSLLSGCSTVSHFKTENAIETQLKNVSESKKELAKKDSQAIAEQMLKGLAPQIKIELPEIKAKNEHRFDINAQLLPAPALFQTIVDGTGYNLVLTEEVRDPVSINLKDVTIKEALDALRIAYGFEYEIHGRLIKIDKPKFVSKTFQINYLLGTRKGQTDVRVSSGSIGDHGNPSSNQNNSSSSQTQPSNQRNGNTGESSRISTSIQNDFWSTLNTTLTSMLGDTQGQQIVVNPQAGLVFVKASSKDIAIIERYLEQLQNAVARQVMLEAKIVEVNLKDGYQSGVNWALFDGYARQKAGVGTDLSRINTLGELIPGTTPMPLSGSLGLLSPVSNNPLAMAFTNSSFSALLSFLETQGSAKVLSTPRVATLNNQKAVLKVGSDDFFVTNITTNTTNNGNSTSTSPTISVQSFFSGIALDVTPQIDDNGFVTIHIHPSISDVSEKQKTIDLGSLGTYNLPLASSSINESDSIVRIKNGQIVAIGGLMRVSSNKDNSKVPYVGDLSFAGNLFKRVNENVSKSELIILIKPTIIERESDWNQNVNTQGWK